MFFDATSFFLVSCFLVSHQYFSILVSLSINSRFAAPILEVLKRKGIKKPTPIQMQGLTVVSTSCRVLNNEMYNRLSCIYVHAGTHKVHYDVVVFDRL